MFENRPSNQQKIIAEIQKHSQSVILAAKKEAKVAESAYYMPMTIPSLRYLLDICNAIMDKQLKKWQESEKARAERELGWKAG